MERKKAVLCSVLIVLLTFASVATRGVEGRLCSSPSQLFEGPCVVQRNCEVICQKEKYAGGICLALACICQKPCI